MKQKQKKNVEEEEHLLMNSRVDRMLRFLWSDGVPWSCGWGTLTSFSDGVKKCDREAEEGTYRENIGSCVQSRVSTFI